MDDIDLNFDDFVAQVNSDLVGKLVNIASRCAGFIPRGRRRASPPALPDPATLPRIRARRGRYPSPADFERAQ